MMIACCIPMLVIAVALVVTGVVSISFLVFAVACTAMMTLMMRGVGGMGGTEPTALDHPGRQAASAAPAGETWGGCGAGQAMNVEQRRDVDRRGTSMVWPGPVADRGVVLAVDAGVGARSQSFIDHPLA